MSLLSLLVFVTLWALGCLGAGTETRQGQLLATSSLYPATLNSLAPKSTAPATATPLPQLPTGHDACVFEDLEGLVDRAVEDWAGYNVSLLVETCPNVCEVAFGTGNPDISGPGVSSLISQARDKLTATRPWCLTLSRASPQSSSDPCSASASYLPVPSPMWTPLSRYPRACGQLNTFFPRRQAFINPTSLWLCP